MPTLRSTRMGWWQMRLAMSLTSSECRVAENIMTCMVVGVQAWMWCQEFICGEQGIWHVSQQSIA